jgi:hypothetical protein
MPVELKCACLESGCGVQRSHSFFAGLNQDTIAILELTCRRTDRAARLAQPCDFSGKLIRLKTSETAVLACPSDTYPRGAKDLKLTGCDSPCPLPGLFLSLPSSSS